VQSRSVQLTLLAVDKSSRAQLWCSDWEGEEKREKSDDDAVRVGVIKVQIKLRSGVNLELDE